MAVTINDILKLTPFRGARILAGADHLHKVIKGVSTADNPASDEDQYFSNTNYFILSSFYFVGKSVPDMQQYLQTYFDTGVACLCLIDEYISELPDEIVKLCNENHFPVIMVDKHVPYADMIFGIMQAIIFDQQNYVLENKLSALISGHLDELQRSKILHEINPQLKSHITAIYCLPDTPPQTHSALFGTINRDITMSALEYKEGFLFLVSYKDGSAGAEQKKIDYVIETINRYMQDCVIGVSSSNSLLDCGNAISQAITAVNSHSIKNSRVIYYNNLGIVRLLKLFSGHKELDQFYSDILGPILEFDQKTNQSNLFETMDCFIQNGRDFRKTAKALFLHENTIRYRVAKVQELVAPKCSSDDFLEDLSIAIKIYKLRKAEKMV